MKKYITNTKVYGIGIADLCTYDDNKKILLSYTTWRNMMARCYSATYQKRWSTYIGCSVCDEWLLFSNFKKFYDLNYRENFHLDKDLLVDGNKIYSPSTCIFVPLYINNLFTDRGGKRGKYPIGVSYEAKARNKYKACISIDSVIIHLGMFPDVETAHLAWLTAKREYIRTTAINAYMVNDINETTMNAIIRKGYNLT